MDREPAGSGPADRNGNGSLAPVVTCGVCDGMTFRVVPCTCTIGGDQLLLDPATDPASLSGEVFRDCRVCRGAGSLFEPCRACDQQGKRRAQLVLTVVDADSGRSASRTVLPGTVEPVEQESGWWVLPLGQVVAELAVGLGVPSTLGGTASLVEVTELAGALGLREHRRPYDPDRVVLPLPHRWWPDLPAEQRLAIEAKALAEHSRRPWRVWLAGRCVPPPPPSGDVLLSRLRRAADLLLVDLVVEARRTEWGELAWTIRFELPGGDVPVASGISHPDLLEALWETSVLDAANGLEERGLTAPAHQVRTGALDRLLPGEPVDVEQLERRIFADAAPAPGAQAIWRNGRWWHTRLHVGGSTEVLSERTTGQISRQVHTILHRVWEPPQPAWWGEPVPYSRCPDCVPEHRLTRCPCLLGQAKAEDDCGSCFGSGWAATVFSCRTCHDSRRIYSGLTVTVTDLTSRAIHQRWPADTTIAPVHLANQPGGLPVYQLARPYQLDHHASSFGVRPEHLTRLDGQFPVSQHLREGVATSRYLDSDPIVDHIQDAARGQPGARMFVVAAPPQAPTIGELLRIAHGLHLALVITLVDFRHLDHDPCLAHGHGWSIDIVPPDLPADQYAPPHHPSPETAAAHCFEHFKLVLDKSVPTDPEQMITAPRQSIRADQSDPISLLVRLAPRYPGLPVSLTVVSDHCTVHLHLSDQEPLRLVRATTLTQAATVLYR